MLRKRGLKIAAINEYEEKLAGVKYDWLKKIDVRTVIDVGAGEGGFAGRIRQIFPEAYIYSFEPLPSSFSKLTRNFSADRLFEAHRLLLGDREGTASFYENEYSGSSSMLKMKQAHMDAYPFTKNMRQVEVPADTLDHFFREIPLREKILLKMDVQGAEHIVLKGAEELIKKTSVIFTEISFRPLYENSMLFNGMISLLEKENFTIAGLENISQSLHDGSFLQADVIFTRRK